MKGLEQEKDCGRKHNLSQGIAFQCVLLPVLADLASRSGGFDLPCWRIGLPALPPEHPRPGGFDLRLCRLSTPVLADLQSASSEYKHL
ncbi:MAG: hypothetical protein IJ615_11535 [Bacteroidaceae bacterium]|nr:hypothetical protein [Bacteroidaceae bacterium]